MTDSTTELRELLEKIRLRVVEVVRRTKTGHLLDERKSGGWFTHHHVSHVELGNVFHWQFTQYSRGEHKVSFTDVEKSRFLFEFTLDPHAADPNINFTGTRGRTAFPCYKEDVDKFRRLLNRILEELHNIPWMLLDDLASI